MRAWIFTAPTSPRQSSLEMGRKSIEGNISSPFWSGRDFYIVANLLAKTVMHTSKEDASVDSCWLMWYIIWWRRPWELVGGLRIECTISGWRVWNRQRASAVVTSKKQLFSLYSTAQLFEASKERMPWMIATKSDALLEISFGEEQPPFK